MLTGRLLCLQGPGSPAVGARLRLRGGHEEERSARLHGPEHLLAPGVRPAHALALTPPLRGGHLVAQLRAAGGLRPARAAQPRAV